MNQRKNHSPNRSLTNRSSSKFARDVIDKAQMDFDARYPGFTLSPITVLICAYEEEGNIYDVLSKVPSAIGDLEVSTLVVVDGGDDSTAQIALEAGVFTFIFEENLGHGVALRVGYDLCIKAGTRYVVTIDADGQNDPGEIPGMLEALINNEADFVVASRRLGQDETTDRMRKAGVRAYSWLTNRLIRTDLTDTSNGYRALRTTMLADVVSRLKQDQYQTAELVITAVKRGWRITECPTIWHPRHSGKSKKGSNLLFGFRYGRVIISTWWRER